MTLILEHSPAYIAVCLLVAVVYAFLLYRKAKRLEAGILYRWLLAILRGTVVFTLAFLLLGPMFKAITSELERPLLIWLQDDSASLSATADSTTYRTQYLNEVEGVLLNLSEDYDVQKFSFGRQLLADSSVKFNQQQTDFSSAFDQLSNRFYGRNIGAVIVASDGIYNRGVNPLFAARGIQVPMYTVAMGDTSTKKDLILDRIVYNAVAYEGNQFPVEVLVRSEGYGDHSVIVRVRSMDQLIIDTILITNGISRKTLLVTAQKEGFQKVNVELDPLIGELTTKNNQESVFVDVLKGRQKVLVLGHGPHPDLGAFRRALEVSSLYEVDVVYAADFDGEFDSFNMAIIHNLPSGKKAPQWMAKLKASELPFFMVLGERVNVKTLNQLDIGVKISGNRSNTNLVQVSTNGDFRTFSLTSDQKALLPELPPLTGPFGNYALNRSSEALLTQRIGTINTEAPLLWFAKWEGRNVGFLAGEGWWKWALQSEAKGGKQESINTLVRKIVQFLATREEKSRFRVTTKRKVLAYEEVVFEAQLYDASYEMVEGAEVSLLVKDEAGQEYPVAFTSANGRYQVSMGKMAPGNYAFSASTNWNGEQYTTSGGFAVMALYQEMVNLKADHDVLFRMAREHDGAMIYSDRINELPALINANEEIKSVSREFTDYTELVEWRWIGLLIIGLMSIEWFLRKRAGAY